MWLFNAFRDNFGLPTHEGHLQLFRILFGLACTTKFTESLRHGGWERFAPGTFERHRIMRTQRTHVAEFILATYRPLLIARLLAGVAVLCGVATKEGLVVIVVALAIENYYEFRRHTTFMALCALLMLPAHALGRGLELSSATSSQNTWAQALIVLLVVEVYWNSAWLKIRSSQFHSGRLLAQLMHFNLNVRTRLPYREFIFPRPVRRLLCGNGPAEVARWRLLSRATIVMETLLPLGLLFRPTYAVAVGLGIAMHTAFTFLVPRRLVPFSLATVATYALFIP